MLRITIDNPKQQKQYLHEAGPLVLGRQPGGDEAQIVIDDDYVSRRHLLLEQVSHKRMRFENVGRNDLELPDGTKIGQGACGEIDLPTRLRIGRTIINVVRQEMEPLLDLSHPDESRARSSRRFLFPRHASCLRSCVIRWPVWARSPRRKS